MGGNQQGCDNQKRKNRCGLVGSGRRFRRFLLVAIEFRNSPDFMVLFVPKRRAEAIRDS